jgi:hypothetical protein
MAAAKQWKERTCTRSITQNKCKLQPLPAPPVGYEDNSLGVNSVKKTNHSVRVPQLGKGKTHATVT